MFKNNEIPVEVERKIEATRSKIQVQWTEINDLLQGVQPLDIPSIASLQQRGSEMAMQLAEIRGILEIGRREQLRLEGLDERKPAGIRSLFG